MSNNIKLLFKDKDYYFNTGDYYYDITDNNGSLFVGCVVGKLGNNSCKLSGWVSFPSMRTVKINANWWDLNLEVLYNNKFSGFKLRKLKE